MLERCDHIPISLLIEFPCVLAVAARTDTIGSRAMLHSLASRNCADPSLLRLVLERYFIHFTGRSVIQSAAVSQEMASRGVCMLYEAGDEGVRSQLVGSLVGVLGGSGARAPKVRMQRDLLGAFVCLLIGWAACCSPPAPAAS